MNRKQLRDRVWAQMDHAPAASPEELYRINGKIDRALGRLAQEAPYLFSYADRQAFTDPDITPRDSTDTLLPVVDAPGVGVAPAMTDRWVLRTSYTTADSKYFQWFPYIQNPLGRELSGRTLRIKDPTINTHTVYYDFVILQVKAITLGIADGQGQLSTTYAQIVLDRPYSDFWDGATVLSDWRVLTEEYPLPRDVIQVQSLRFPDEDRQRRPVPIIARTQAEQLGLEGGDTQDTAGLPQWAYRGSHARLDAPIYTPTLTTAQGGWIATSSEEPTGSFQYCFTIGLGERAPAEAFAGPARHSATGPRTDDQPPWLESGPSEESDVFDNSGTTDGAVLNLPDLDRIYGYHDSAQPRFGGVGFKKYIYRRRLSTSDDDYDADERYYLIAVVGSGATSWTDDGTLVPDRSRPLYPASVQNTLRFYPRPDQSYRMVYRAVVRPLPLRNDYDTIPVPDDALDALIFKVLQYAYEAAGNAAMQDNAKNNYDLALFELNKDYNGSRPPGQPLRRKRARVRGRRRRRRQFPTVEDA